MIENQYFNRVVLEVDLKAISSNILAYQKAIAPAQFLAVVKAYGYGTFSLTPTEIEPMITTCLKLGVKRFAVSRLTEAEELRRLVPLETNILLLGNFFLEEIEGLVHNRITVTVSDSTQLIQLEEISSNLKIMTEVQILIDTGMGRLGIPFREAKEKIREFITLNKKQNYLKITGLYSHLANAHVIDDDYTKEQIKKFISLKEWLKETFPIVEGWEFHLANSWGAGNYRESHQDLVRVGIGLYGVEPQPMKWVAVKPAVTLKSYLLAKRFLPAGHRISYDCGYILPQDTWVGTVAAGYADGIPLSLSSFNHNEGVIQSPFSYAGHVLIQGQSVPIIGKVTMDYTLVDLNGIKADPGDEVVFFGRSGEKEIRVRDFADIKKTHGYDILCSLPLTRVARVYLNS